MKRIIVAIFVICLLCIGIVQAEVEYESDYEVALNMAGNDLFRETNLMDAINLLKSTGTYKFSKSYTQYFQALLDILPEEGDFRTARIRIETCGRTLAFTEDLAARGFPSCEEILSYIDARELQAEGDYGTAYEMYAAMGILDAPERAFDMMILIDSMTPSVAVIYKADDGTILDQETVEISRGSEKTITAKTIDGYLLSNSNQNTVTVMVDNLGHQSTKEIVFLYHALPDTVSVHVTYMDKNGEVLGETDMEVERGASKVLLAESIDGYVIAEGTAETVTIFVDREGNASQEQVTFWYTAISKETTSAYVIPENAFIAQADGYYGQPITVYVTLDENGAIATLHVDASTETDGLGTKCAEPAFTDQFVGKSSKFYLSNGWLTVKNGIEIQAVSGATITSQAIVDAVNEILWEAYWQPTQLDRTKQITDDLQQWDCVTFGHYPQTTDGTDSTPIEWLVLDVDSKNHKALLISRYILDIIPYHSQERQVTWAHCNLRRWLNDDFLNAAFTTKEQTNMLITIVDNSQSQGYTSYDYVNHSGSSTSDVLFLLSYHEAFKQYFDSDDDRMCGPTDYAIARGARNDSVYSADGKPTWLYWLRSSGDDEGHAEVVNKGGGWGGYPVTWKTMGVRPAFWISLDTSPN